MNPKQDDRIIGFVLCLVGLVAVVVGCFLPYADVASTGFVQIQGNSALQMSYGWTNLVFSGLAAVAIARAYQKGTRTWAPIIWGGLAVAWAVYAATSDDALTFCPIGSTSFGASDCTVAEPGLGIYAIGGGGAALLLGGLFLARKTTSVAVPVVTASATSTSTHRECPFCKEPMRRDAGTCPHCRQNSLAWTFHEQHWWITTEEGNWLWLDEAAEEWRPFSELVTN